MCRRAPTHTLHYAVSKLRRGGNVPFRLHLDIMDQLDEFYDTGFLFDFGSAHKHNSTRIALRIALSSTIYAIVVTTEFAKKRTFFESIR